MRFGMESMNQLARYANSFQDIQVIAYRASNGKRKTCCLTCIGKRFAQCHVISGLLS